MNNDRRGTASQQTGQDNATYTRERRESAAQEIKRQRSSTLQEGDKNTRYNSPHNTTQAAMSGDVQLGIEPIPRQILMKFEQRYTVFTYTGKLYRIQGLSSFICSSLPMMSRWYFELGQANQEVYQGLVHPKLNETMSPGYIIPQTGNSLSNTFNSQASNRAVEWATKGLSFWFVQNSQKGYPMGWCIKDSEDTYLLKFAWQETNPFVTFNL